MTETHLGLVPDPQEHPTLTVDETAEILGLSRVSTYEGVKCGEIPSIRVGRRILVPTAAVRRMLDLDKEITPEERLQAASGAERAAEAARAAGFDRLWDYFASVNRSGGGDDAA